MKFNIDKWMEICEKYGAKFENIKFVLENEVFVKAVAIDKTKPVFIRVPFPCLAWYEEIDFEGGVK